MENESSTMQSPSGISGAGKLGIVLLLTQLFSSFVGIQLFSEQINYSEMRCSIKMKVVISGDGARRKCNKNRIKMTKRLLVHNSQWIKREVCRELNFIADSWHDVVWLFCDAGQLAACKTSQAAKPCTPSTMYLYYSTEMGRLKLKGIPHRSSRQDRRTGIFYAIAQ
jgi:hypothetical protein